MIVEIQEPTKQSFVRFERERAEGRGLSASGFSHIKQTTVDPLIASEQDTPA